MRFSHSISPTVRAHSRRRSLKRTSTSVFLGENGRSSPPPVLHSSPPINSRGKYLQFHSFDESYVTRLLAGDFRTQEHFGAYFTTLIQLKLRSRLQSREARSPGEAQPSSKRNGTGGGGRCFFGSAIVHRGAPMTHSCTVLAQCARIMERSGRGDFSNSFAIRKKLVDVTGFEPATPCLQSRCSPS
jgi:hypothetical protein